MSWRSAKPSPESPSSNHKNWRPVAIGLIAGLMTAVAITGYNEALRNQQVPEQSHNHSGVMTTIFWAGEAADAANKGISNAPSAWDEHWAEHFGGTDSPGRRLGYLPLGFMPKENPFYVALPYNDFDSNGSKKPTADNCLEPGEARTAYSWCKNSWVAVTYDGKTAYGQWEDVGPLGEDDTAYVFGNAQPRSTFNHHAGLDVSPAIATYLGLTGMNRTSWHFVGDQQVPRGPWTRIITTRPSD